MRPEVRVVLAARMAWVAWVAIFAVCSWIVSAAGADAMPEPGVGATTKQESARAPGKAPGDAIFLEPTFLKVQVRLPKESLEALRRNPKEYAPATVVINGQEMPMVAVRLKGSAGSFRPVDDRPAMTLKFNKWVGGARWAGLRGVHLNNSVQDPTYMSEYLAGELFRASGVPATRVAWARVELNGRELGHYVVKEGFEEEFLRRSFNESQGNLYDGGFLQEIDQPLDRGHGSGPVDRSDLKALVGAAREPDPALRWRRLQERLDVDRFVSYAVVSAMIADWDGYAMNRNNYRIYFRPADGRAVLIPHGTDQLFQRNEMGADPSWNGLLAQALFSLPEGQKLYRERFVEVFTNVFRADLMTNALARVAGKLKSEFPEIRGYVQWASMAVQSRVHSLEQDPMLRGVLPGTSAPARIPKEGLHPAEWLPQSGGESKLEETESGGVRILRIATKGPDAASFRAPVRLPRGRYRFEGRLRTTSVESVRDDKGEGAGLRISGTQQPRRNHVSGDRGWTVVAYDFELASVETEVVLVAELRASRGTAEFDKDSLRVIPVE